MRLRTQILAYGFVGALSAAGVAAIGLGAAHGMGTAIGDAIGGAVALQASQRADMMHDAIRADAQLAELGSLKGNATMITEAEKDLGEHVQVLRQALSDLKGMALDAEAQRQLLAVQPLVSRYVDSAQRLVQAAKRDAGAAAAEVAALQASFGALETELARLSEAIEKAAQATQAVASGSATRAAAGIATALMLALAGLTVIGGWLAARIARPLARAVKAADQLAQGDLDGRIEPEGCDEAVKLLASMQAMQDRFVDIVRTVKTNAESVSLASAQIAQGNNDLSVRTESQASALQQTAASMEQLSETVRRNADSARLGNQLAQGASSVALQGGEVVGRVVQTMKGISDSSRRIADIIGVIDGIAFQTNILALNAAVEAARAGEQGRGFAVVAAEVRSLAQRSAGAAREIKDLISDSVGRVEQGNALVDEAGVTMQQVVDAIRRVTDLMGEISSASTSQSDGVSQVGQAMSQMDTATQQNAALVEESAAAAESLRSQAVALVGAVAAFKLQGGRAAA